jgi:tRNA-Thr(GGU) m(6)t(6)A37 methyltransferase TsaA
MQTSRRNFMAAVTQGMAGAGLLAAWTTARGATAEATAEPESFYRLYPIGRVERKGKTVGLRIFDRYVEGLLGLEDWSHVNVLYWFDQNDTPQRRRVLRVHPRGDKQNPLTGVFACRAPVRPNLIALSLCKILSVRGNFIQVEDLDALDASPVLDLKPFVPLDAPTQGVRVPAWAKPPKQPGS